VYKVPISFIRYHRRTPEEWKATLEYNADAEDEVWLDQKLHFRAIVGISGENHDEASSRLGPQLSLELFERIMDIMDKATAFESIITISQAEVLIQAKIPQVYRMFPVKARQGVVSVKHVIQEVYNYWIQKRSKLKRPLLRRFWPVTSTDDTNPHMVFRPREKEKYKLRKKRQNDANAYRKMKQLRDDFDNLRAVLEIARHREELQRVYIKLQVDLFQQQLYDAIDTSGYARPSKRLNKSEVSRLFNEAPSHFDIRIGGRKAKRTRQANGLSSSLPTISFPFATGKKDMGRSGPVTASAVNVAGRNNGDPAPNFLQPVPTRESYVTSWEGAVPYVPTYDDSRIQPTYRFRQRPRVGRGGRLCVDRLPLPSQNQSGLLPEIVYTAGYGMLRSLDPKERLLDLLPKPLDHALVSRRVEALSVAAIEEDFAAQKLNPIMPGDGEENDGDEVIVRLDEWLETDEQEWGEERYAIGPI
jgi:enhancer of polycomb-like protein